MSAHVAAPGRIRICRYSPVASLLTLSSTGIRAGMGGRLRFLRSGGAPLSKSSPNFSGPSHPHLPGYGLTETSPLSPALSDNAWQFRQPIPDVPSARRRRANSRQGALRHAGLLRIRATREVLSQGRLFRTGDIGSRLAQALYSLAFPLRPHSLAPRRRRAHSSPRTASRKRAHDKPPHPQRHGLG